MRLEVEPSSQLYNFLHMACCATPPPIHTHTLQRISSLMMRSRTLLNKSKRCNRLQCPREPHPNNTTQPLYVIFALLPMHKLQLWQCHSSLQTYCYISWYTYMCVHVFGDYQMSTILIRAHSYLCSSNLVSSLIPRLPPQNEGRREPRLNSVRL